MAHTENAARGYAVAGRRRKASGAFWAYAVLLMVVTPWIGPAHRAIAKSKVEADFNGDGRADLAVGVPGENWGRDSAGAGFGPGAVNIIYGSAEGLTSSGNQMWSQDSPGIEGVAEPDDLFGMSLAAGDFNGDGRDDLAIGVPWEGDGGFERFAGAVNVLYGGDLGLTALGNQIWTQDSPGIEGVAKAGEEFGLSLAAGDFNGDGRDDLAIGARGQNVASELAAGAVHILYGSAAGLTADGSQLWTQNSPGVADTAEALDYFGGALAAGDFDRSGTDDLAIGVPRESVGGGARAGAVNILRGSPAGLTATLSQFWTQDVPGILDAAENDDFFGDSLAVGDFDGDSTDDLAVGVPGESLGSTPVNAYYIIEAGAVAVLYGAPWFGLTITGNQFWSEDSPGVDGVAERHDSFGQSLAAGDFDGYGVDDLAIGVPGVEGFGTFPGAVNILYGVSGSGLSSLNNQVWTQNSPGIVGVAETPDAFGRSLTAGDFDGDGRDDLAIGVPGESVSANVLDGYDAGAVNVLYGMTLFGLTAINNQIWSQIAPGVDSEQTSGIAESHDRFGRGLPN